MSCGRGGACVRAYGRSRQFVDRGESAVGRSESSDTRSRTTPSGDRCDLPVTPHVRDGLPPQACVQRAPTAGERRRPRSPPFVTSPRARLRGVCRVRSGGPRCEGSFAMEQPHCQLRRGVAWRCWAGAWSRVCPCVGAWMRETSRDAARACPYRGRCAPIPAASVVGRAVVVNHTARSG